MIMSEAHCLRSDEVCKDLRLFALISYSTCFFAFANMLFFLFFRPKAHRQEAEVVTDSTSDSIIAQIYF